MLNRGASSGAPLSFVRLGGCALQRPLAENLPTGRARLALDLVRDPAALTQNVRRDRLVAMCFRGSHSCHAFRLESASGVFCLSPSRRNVLSVCWPEKVRSW